MESKIIKKLSVNFDKEIIVERVLIDKEIVQMHQNRLTELYKDLPENEKISKIDQSLRDIILKDNFFNKIMEFIVPYYEFDISKKDLDENIKTLKQNFPQRKDDILNQIAERSIQKALIFKDLQKQFNLTLTEKQIEENLSQSASNIGENFEKIKADKERYDSLASLLQDEYIISFLLSKFPLRVNLPYDWQTHQIMLFRVPKQQADADATIIDNSSEEKK